MNASGQVCSTIPYLHVAALPLMGVVASTLSGNKSEDQRISCDHFAERVHQMTVRRERPTGYYCSSRATAQ